MLLRCTYATEKYNIHCEDCGARGFPLSDYCCIPLHSQVCINQRNVLVAVEVYGFQISSEQNGQATGRGMWGNRLERRELTVGGRVWR
jgi:hypothetical protein